MENKNYKDALVQLSEFVKQREELVAILEESIDKSIIDRTLPFDYKEKYVEWQQDLLDIVLRQSNEAKEYMMTLDDNDS